MATIDETGQLSLEVGARSLAVAEILLELIEDQGNGFLERLDETEERLIERVSRSRDLGFHKQTIEEVIEEPWALPGSPDEHECALGVPQQGRYRRLQDGALAYAALAVEDRQGRCHQGVGDALRVLVAAEEKGEIVFGIGLEAVVGAVGPVAHGSASICSTNWSIFIGRISTLRACQRRSSTSSGSCWTAQAKPRPTCRRLRRSTRTFQSRSP